MKYHFTPNIGWINDPNGAICIEGVYHLFYQHYPDDIVWGPMHWGHAVSTDLLHWEHKPIAIKPDALGYIFSGSCIYDKENVSGLAKGLQKPLFAFYTSHNPLTGEQQQSVAISYDFETFAAYEKNPIIANVRTEEAFMPDFRDPKVFANPVLGGYSMVLAAGKKLFFYHSMNLLAWTKTGEFEPYTQGYGGICECPDCFPIECEEKTKWILSLSNIIEDKYVGKPVEKRGYGNAHVMQYFVGDFDGYTFVDTQKNAAPLILDNGPDNYAMVTFAGLKKPLMIGWGEHWDYVTKTPASGYRGKMTIPREVSLKHTSKGYRLSFTPIETGEAEDFIMTPGQMLELETLGGGLLLIKVTEEEIVVDRRGALQNAECEMLTKEGYSLCIAERLNAGPCSIQILQDEGYYEIFAEDGLIQFSVMTY